MRVIIKDTTPEVAQWAARYIVDAINAKAAKTPAPFVLGLPTGSTPLETYKELIRLHTAGEVSFKNVVTFNMDEYIGLSADAPQGFGNFLKEHIFGVADFKSVNYIDVTATDADAECERYSKLLRENPTDIVVMGIGENGHIAFNDPPVADFRDVKKVKSVLLDEICRNQQVHDGCFATLDDVPKMAITLTVPTLFAGKYLFCIVPAKTKAFAVRDTINGDISEKCPASVLRMHTDAILYLDSDSASLL